MAGIKIPGKLTPGIVDNYLLDSTAVKGGYMTVATLEDRDNLISNSKAVTPGTLIYVEETGIAYKYTSENNFVDDKGEVKDDISKLNNDLLKEVADREAADLNLQSNINVEASNRETADNTLQQNIDTEKSRAISAENNLKLDIESETSRALGVENNLQSSISKTNQDLKDLESNLQNQINQEITARTNSDDSLKSSINSLQSNLEGQINQEASSRESADNLLQVKLDNEIERAKTAENTITISLNNEITRATNAETLLQNNINTLQSNLNKEITNRETNDTSLDNKITAEANTRYEADNQIRIDLNDEVASLDTRINTVADSVNNTNEALTAETNRAIGVENSKYDKTGGLIDGDVEISGNLKVSGTTTTLDTESLEVKNNYIITNSDDAELINSSGIIIRKGSKEDYGIVYNPSEDAVELGTGTYKDGVFTNNEVAGVIATRAKSQEITDGNIIQWQETGNRLVDSGKKVSDFTPSIDTNSNIKAKDNYGAYVDIPYSIEADDNSLVIRDGEGYSYINTPIGSSESYDKAIANKGYVDNVLAISAETFDGRLNGLNTLIIEETENRQSADTNLQTQITTLNTNLTKETNSRTTADSDLQSKIDAEVARATTKEQEIESKLNKEIQDRTTADSDLQSKIDAVLGTSGVVTLSADGWDTTNKTQIITLAELGKNDAVFFAPNTYTDSSLLNYADLFSSTGTSDNDYNVVTFTATAIPISNITLNFFIVRGGAITQ